MRPRSATDSYLNITRVGVVIHPNVRIGNNVRIYHHVTLAAESWIGSRFNIEIEDDTIIGVGAIVMARTDQGLRIGRNARIGAGAVVTHDVADGETVVGVPARPVRGNTCLELLSPSPRVSPLSKNKCEDRPVGRSGFGQ